MTSEYIATKTHTSSSCNNVLIVWEYGLSLNPDKCIFMVAYDMIRGFVGSKEGKFCDPKKIHTLLDMLALDNVRSIKVFNRLPQFTKGLIRDYAEIMAPITKLTQKATPF